MDADENTLCSDIAINDILEETKLVEEIFPKTHKQVRSRKLVKSNKNKDLIFEETTSALN